jgi:hypothetical protein
MASTLVSDLIEEIQDRIPENKLPNLFPALNRAIKIIADRLYLLDSSLVIGELSVSAYASVDYTASTIAFVDGGVDAVDTITDSANQFVTEGFEADMPIETTCTSNLGPFRVTAVVAGTLTIHIENSVTKQIAGSSYKITSIADYGYLPDDFGGFVEKPYINGYTWELLPLPNQAAKLAYSSAGVTKFYKLKGNRLYLIPATNTDITIKGDYYKRATAITKMSNYVPFYGAMDGAIQEYLIKVLGGDPSGAEAALLALADLAASKRDKKAPVGMPGGIEWGF